MYWTHHKAGSTVTLLDYMNGLDSRQRATCKVLMSSVETGDGYGCDIVIHETLSTPPGDVRTPLNVNYYTYKLFHKVDTEPTETEIIQMLGQVCDYLNGMTIGKARQAQVSMMAYEPDHQNLPTTLIAVYSPGGAGYDV